MRHFLKQPFDIDGWRFDVGNHTGNFDGDLLSHQVWRMCRAAIKDEKPDAYIVGEHWEDPSAYLQGDQWDSAMNYFASGRPLRRFMGGMDRFTSPDDGPHRISRPLAGSEVWAQMFQHFGRIPNQLVWAQFNLIDSHDIWRLHNNTTVYNENIYRGVIAAMFMLPGTMNIYYGDETGINGTVEDVEGCRYSMPWEKDQQNDSFMHLYTTLSRLKRNEPALHYGSLRCLFADEDTLALVRFTRKRAVISVLNKAKEPRTITLPLGGTGELAASSLKHIPLIPDTSSVPECILSREDLTLSLEPEQQVLLTAEINS